MTIKSFRGQIEDAGTDTIILHTNDGSTGYRIVKFQIMPVSPGTVASEHTVQVWKVAPTTAIPTTTPDINFSDNTLLGAAIVGNSTNITSSYSEGTIIFDNEIFNQDIYITHTEANGTAAVNYYLELEQIKLDLPENTVATLKDIRNIASQ